MGMPFWQGKRVLVTGGAGFVGQYLVKELIREGAQVKIVDNLSRGKIDRITGLGATIAVEDLNDDGVAERACRHMDAVFHLASPVGGLYWNQGRQYGMFSEAMKSTLAITDAAVKTGVERLALASSACVYPAGVPIPMKEEATLDGPPEPGSEGYGWAKRMSEYIAEWLMAESSLKVAVFRPANAIGPDDVDDDSGHVIPQLLKRIMEGQNPLVVYGSGKQLREFLHAKDYALGAMACLERAADGKVVNLGSGFALTIEELAHRLLNLTGNGQRPITFDLGKAEGHKAKLHNLTRLHEEVGFKATIKLNAALEEIVTDYKERWDADKGSLLHQGSATPA
jgi:nucleoside-diphosphate-sugar epimerase